METEIPEYVAGASEYVALTYGIHFPRQRWHELLRLLTAAAGDLGFAGRTEDFARWLGGTPELSEEQFEVLASYLTVGETYFFREQRYFDVFADQILSEIVSRRRSGERSIRLWSAGCCTGEEAYSIAIVLRRVIADLREWRITLLATDINPRFLRKARAGIFGHWSFRNTPPAFKETYFRAIGGGQFEILPEIRRMVRFEPLNLARYSGSAAMTDAMDVIFCRNVLMYFEPASAARVFDNFYRSQNEGGWLIVGSSELTRASSSPYSTVSCPDAVLYRKHTRASRGNAIAEAPSVPALRSAAVPPLDASPENGTTNREQGPKAAGARVSTAEVDGHRLLARGLANQGKLAEALDHCDRWIAADRFDPAAHYLRALILQERGNHEGAQESLRTALYLDPAFALAHFALGNLSRVDGKAAAARRHFANAAETLRGLDPEMVLLESEGITAGELARMIPSLLREGVSG
jgi:chemotaxis protein methyltransferase CheR